MIGKLIGKKGETLKKLQDETHCKIHVDSKNDTHGAVKSWRKVQVRSTAVTVEQQESSSEFCLQIIRALCQEQGSQLSIEDAINALRAEAQIEEQKKHEADLKARQDEAVRQVMIVVGDCFSDTEIRDALMQTGWDADQAQDRLFQKRRSAESQTLKPMLDAKRLLDSCRAKNAERKLRESGDADSSEMGSEEFLGRGVDPDLSTVSANSVVKPSKAVQMIRDVFAENRRKCMELDQKIR